MEGGASDDCGGEGVSDEVWRGGAPDEVWREGPQMKCGGRGLR